MILRRAGGGTLLVVAVAVAFLAIYRNVLLGHASLVAGDDFFTSLPWAASAGAHAAGNSGLGDPAFQMLPWHQLSQEALRHWRLPLWNPYAFSGIPLMANAQSAPLSPFNLLGLPFGVVHGFSLGMLAKLWVAGAGVALFVRQLGGRWWSGVAAGVAFALSSFMTIWLGSPHTAVAALVPWCFASAEWYVRSRSRLALAALAAAIAAQFLSGHPETSEHFVGGLAVYLLARLAGSPGSAGRRALGLTLAAAVGSALAAVQLLPFIAELRRASTLGSRGASGIGALHLGPDSLFTWIAPNALGNPGIPGPSGPLPNYNEAVGFAGVTALFLAVAGAWWLWKRSRSAVVGLTVIAASGVGLAYGPLSPIAGRLPILQVTANQRAIVLACFTVSVLGGLGVEALLNVVPARGSRRAAGAVVLGLGFVLLGALVVAGAIVGARPARVATLLTAFSPWVGFWVVVAGLSCLAAACVLVGGFVGGHGRAAAALASALILVEGLIFAVPFTHRVPMSEVPPRSVAADWAGAHAGAGYFAATGGIFAEEGAIFYGLRDVRGYDVFIDPRVDRFWRGGDPGYVDDGLHITLKSPSVEWLRAAGVTLVMTQPADVVPGTQPAFAGEGVTIATVPNARPFAFAATSVRVVDGLDQASADLSPGAGRPVVVERCCAQDGAASVSVTRRDAGEVALDVRADRPATVVILQAMAPGWVATIDGRPAAMNAADVLFQSVAVPTGRHAVELRYDPPPVRQGIVVSGLGVVALVVLVASGLTARARRRPSEAQAGPGSEDRR